MKSGYIVKTKSGFIGRTKHGDKPINGKVIVYIEENNKPVMDSRGQQMKMLCSPEGLQKIGYVD